MNTIVEEVGLVLAGMDSMQERAFVLRAQLAATMYHREYMSASKAVQLADKLLAELLKEVKHEQ